MNKLQFRYKNIVVSEVPDEIHEGCYVVILTAERTGRFYYRNSFIRYLDEKELQALVDSLIHIIDVVQGS